ncbi:sigma-54 dependent transcriptional regulator [Oceanimonas sp. MB9]|uniref:sigma-54-dependent transcriptional regulator n=1 Tax=Oceanimonas sp. MB9 TaxID=2588453 RepID=UPI0013F59AAA|nr:sigma-54 dependent transcriptional regulator [Oceanimonas sp. MB9]NHI01099.1 C4-dicarboxylate transport transcriptional regulatory protein DctD [Oceanimonas sp. MB9]
MTAPYILLIDDDDAIRRSAAQTLELEDYRVQAFDRADKALPQLDENFAGIVITDINMPGITGLELLERIRIIDTDIPVILITGFGDISMAVSAIQSGAYDFIEKPFSSDLLLDVVHRALEKRALTLDNRRLRLELQAQSAPGPRIIGGSPAVQELRRLVQTVASSPADILLMGETGSGKDLLARYIHEHSPRREQNFVAINCGGMPESLIESELFGHEKGAFTDAKEKRIGKLEHAQGGTLFLDEIESMPMSLQIKLLRVLEERTIERLGSNRLIPLDIRIVAATKADLRALADAGDFREDLYYRLNVVRIDIPPLRARPDDIPMLFQHFALLASALYEREIPPLSAERLHQLLSHSWPGNVRELRNLAERYVLLGEACSFDLGDHSGPDSPASGQSLAARVDQFEKTLIQTELARHGGSIKHTQESLQLPRKTLYDKMKKHGLDKNDYKG